jgi:hypothetical protein
MQQKAIAGNKNQGGTPKGTKIAGQTTGDFERCGDAEEGTRRKLREF